MLEGLIGAIIGFFGGILIAMVKAQFDYSNLLRNKIERIATLIHIDILKQKSIFQRKSVNLCVEGSDPNALISNLVRAVADEANKLSGYFHEVIILLELYFPDAEAICTELISFDSKISKIIDDYYQTSKGHTNSPTLSKNEKFKNYERIKTEEVALWTQYYKIKSTLQKFLIKKSKNLKPFFSREDSSDEDNRDKLTHYSPEK